jgi:S-DNA-T family DNA segregation ATPase FtsK/SpoIIIE
MNHLFKRFRRDIIGIIWLSIGIFLGVALFSFHPTDPSLNSIGKALIVKNFCGYLGSFIADALYQILGIAAWLIPIGAAKKAIAIFNQSEPKKDNFRPLWAALLILSGASLLSVYWPAYKIFSGQIYLGGLLGTSFSKILMSALNFAGVQIILWMTILALTVFYTEKSVPELFGYMSRFVQAIYRFIPGLPRWSFITSFFKGVAHRIMALREMISSWATTWAQGDLVTESVAASQSASGLSRSSLGNLESRGGGEVARKFFPIDAKPEGAQDESAEDESPRRRRVLLKKKIQHRVANWELPKLNLLEDPPYGRKRVDEREIREKSQILLNKLQQFGVDGEVVDANPGPAVTMFEFKPNADVKISNITQLADDLSLALSAESLRIIAPIPGRDVVGIETSNATRETVYLKDILASDSFWDESIALPLAIGCEASGNQKIVDLRKMPHMLVAGTTGSGKSVFITSLLSGLIFRHSPQTLRLILIDPKQVDLAAFTDIPHLLMPTIRDPRQAVSALRWSTKEMEKRYRSMHKFGARDLEGYNAAVSNLSKAEIEEHIAANDDETGLPKTQTYYYTPLPYIVLVCEEFGDVMAVDKANVEQGVVRLAQMARACGIHLILAMQSPRKDVVTGLIKTNIPGRVSFKVASKMDSRIIIDDSGAERLLARGDMLYVAPGTSKPLRHHGPWVADKEIEAVTNFWKNQSAPEYDPLAMRALEGNAEGVAGVPGFEADDDLDEKYDEIVAFVSTVKEVSASLLQRRFKLGYPRAARLIEQLEAEGTVGPANGSKPRSVLINELK